MGILSLGKKKDLDPTKREVGFGVLEIYPYLFSSAEDFFKELKKECLEYLTDEEQDAILEHFTMERRSFRALVPKDAYKRVEKKMAGVDRGDSPFQTFVVRCNSTVESALGGCWCGNRWSRGCCGGPVATDEFHQAFYRGLIEEEDPRLKDYFILSHVNRTRESWDQQQASINARAAVDEFEGD